MNHRTGIGSSADAPRLVAMGVAIAVAAAAALHATVGLVRFDLFLAVG